MRKNGYSILIILLLIFIQQIALAEVPVEVIPSLAPMLEKVTPAVVNISTRTRIRNHESPLWNDPFFRFFFNVPEKPRERYSQSLGSGVVLDAKKGYVVTNNHVIDKASEITVTLRDGRTLNADLVGTDAETDIALLKVPTENLISLPLADSDRLRVGDFVVAIGNPFGLGQTVTSGIVSALGRSGLGIEGYEDFIQTDASINPGNSGGALVNLRGELAGINTAILAPSGGNVGIGFAIPINMAYQIVQHLADFGEVKRGFVGLQVQDLTPDLSSAFGLKDQKGAVVVEVVKDSPADQAGLQAGDVIVGVNNQTINNATAVRNRIGLLRVGDPVEISALRKGRSFTVKMMISDSNTLNGKEINPYLEGMTLSDSDEGIKVVEVSRQNLAWRLGFRPDDVIIGFNRRVVKNLAELKKLLYRQSPPFLVRIQRQGENLSILLE